MPCPLPIPSQVLKSEAIAVLCSALLCSAMYCCATLGHDAQYFVVQSGVCWHDACITQLPVLCYEAQRQTLRV